MIFQKEITLNPFSRGFHLITEYISKELPQISGMLNVFIKHTSASLTLNENADPTVREDFEAHFNVLVPESANYFLHTLEGPDDMTSHIKSSLLGSSVNIPLQNGERAGTNVTPPLSETYLLDMPTVTRGNMVMVKAGFWLTEKRPM